MAKYIGEFKPRFIFYDKKIMDIMNRGIITVQGCRTCEFRYVCGSGCPIPAFYDENKMNAPICNAFKNNYIMNNLELFLGIV